MTQTEIPAEGTLMAAPRAIIDGESLLAQIAETAASASAVTEVRAAVVALLRDAVTEGRETIRAAILADPDTAPAARSAYTYLTDEVVQIVYQAAVRWMHPLANPTEAERICLMAVGGYGRAEMAPYSDVDLLFLTPYKQTPWGESVIESMLYTLWDLRLKVGHATRTVEDCIRLGKSDYTIRTALLENRFLAGEKSLAERLNRRLWQDLFANTGSDFVAAKLDERSERHKRTGGSRYMVEPNVKEGKGGLRDLQTLFWIAKYLYRASSPQDLVTQGVFRQDEMDNFLAAEAFLWKTRIVLHLVSGRATEQLTFDAQVEVARALGYRRHDGRRGVEHFMQDYFRHATHVGDLTRIFLTYLEALHVKSRPRFGRAILNKLTFSRDKTGKGYELSHGRLDVVDPKTFLKDPVNFLRLFEEGLQSKILLHPNAMRLVARNLDKIDDDLRQNPEANKIFLELLLSHQNPERALRRMNELGVLGAFIPEFGRIVAMMQFNMYHHYTVDEHIIRCISQLFMIEKRELIEELPIASSILEKGVNRRVLYVALMLHDIGKGLPQDHSIAGAEIANVVAPRLGLSPEECDLVEWLVLNHLLMSDVAQKRDLSDPGTARDFAHAVASRSRLDLLTVLTVCDIRGVGPGVWNNWKAQLLRELYAQTRDILNGGRDARTMPTRVAEAKSALQASLSGWEAKAVKTETERHYDPYWLGLDTETQRIFAELLLKTDQKEPVSRIEPDESRDATRACFVMHDHPGIFARFAGALAIVGADILDARTYTTRDGIATAVFWIQDSEGKPYETSRLKRLHSMVTRTLKGEVITREALKSRDKMKKREREFIVPTQITFDNDGSDIFTIIEVDTRDRPGLLYDLAKTLTDNNISISSAIIATYGEQAVDAFYVKDLFGLKLHSEAKRRTLEARLRAAIERGQEVANA